MSLFTVNVKGSYFYWKTRSIYMSQKIAQKKKEKKEGTFLHFFPRLK